MTNTNDNSSNTVCLQSHKDSRRHSAAKLEFRGLRKRVFILPAWAHSLTEKMNPDLYNFIVLKALFCM